MNILKSLLSVCFVFAIAGTSLAAPSDSLRTEQSEGKWFIIHQVEAKETAYSLARRYNVPVSEIFKENPESKNGLSIGALVKIPVSKNTSAVAEKPANAAAGKKHTVQAGQTLYAVARMYKISVEDIKKWNQLTGDALAEGQELVISATDEKKPEPTNNNREKKKDEVKDVKKEDKNTVTAPVSKNPEPTKKTEMNAGGFENIIETGIAELIDEKDESKKFLALHPTAPYGTILQVTNEQNGLYVFVRVIGKLPDIPAHKNLVVKISKGAWDKLACVDKRFMVKVEYTP